MPDRTMPALARSAGVDLARCAGIIAIIAAHVWTQGTFRDLAYAWHVPVFFFLSGWLWKPGRTLGAELRSRTRTLLVPYAAWLAVIGLLVLGLHARSGGSAGPLAGQMLWGGARLQRPFTAFWFVTALFAVCLIRRVLDPLGLPMVTGVALVTLVPAAVAGPWLASTPWSAGMAIPALAILVAGEWARRLQGRWRYPGGYGLALIAVPLALVGAGLVRPVNLKAGDLGSPVLGLAVSVAVSLGLVLGCEALCAAIPRRGQEAVSALALVGLPVILAHAVVLWLLQTPDAGRVPDFVLAVAVPWAGALVLRRTPLSPFLAGVPVTNTAGGPIRVSRIFTAPRPPRHQA